MAIRSGRFGIDINNPEFTQFRDGAGPRAFRRWIPIAPALPANAGIEAQASIANFDIEKVANARLTVITENVTNAGFDLVISTWADTRIWGVTVSWIAHTID